MEYSPRVVLRSWREFHQNSFKTKRNTSTCKNFVFYFVLQIFAISKQQRKENYHQVESDLLKSSKHWKATIAPMRWQGGDKAPSRNSSLPCRLILNWPDPFFCTGTLKKETHTCCDSRRRPLNDHIESFALAKNTELPKVQWYRGQLKKVQMFLCIYIIITFS